MSKNLKSRSVAPLALGALGFCLIVILWGAWVRISGSGNGCGEHWPLCQNQVIPNGAGYATWVELAHRLSSGLFGLLIVILFFVTRKSKSVGVRRLGLAALILTLVEALIGAKLVLAGLVGDNSSLLRSTVMVVHTLSSFSLTGVLGALWAWDKLKTRIENPKLSPFKVNASAVGWLLMFIAVLVTGAKAALSGTLFPSASLLEGLRADFSSTSHWLVQIRILHPIAATLFIVSASIAFIKRIDQRLTPLALAVLICQFAIGAATLLSLSPIWLKLTHLAFAHTFWIVIILWSLSSRENQRAP